MDPHSSRYVTPANQRPEKYYLEGHKDLVSRLTMWIFRDTKWVIGVISLLTKFP